MEAVNLNTDAVLTDVLRDLGIPHSRWKATCQVMVEGETEVNWPDRFAHLHAAFSRWRTSETHESS